MVDIKGFADLVVNGLEVYLGDGFTISIKDVVKNNGVTYLGVNINDGSRIAPIIYLNSFYEQFSNGEDIESIVDHIISVYRDNRSFPGDFNIEDFMDFNKVKEHLNCKLINARENEELLKEIPHKLFLDLALVFMFSGGEYAECSYSILLRNNHIENWEVTVDEIFRIAIKNIEADYTLKSMGEVMSSIIDTDDVVLDDVDISMSVLSNSSNTYGAVHMINKELLRMYADKHGADVIIIPSSVHECILLPMDGRMDMENIASMIQKVNATQLKEDEILSDHPYFYRRECDEIILA